MKTGSRSALIFIFTWNQEKFYPIWCIVIMRAGQGDSLPVL
jgi:hypothetical protein